MPYEFDQERPVNSENCFPSVDKAVKARYASLFFLVILVISIILIIIGAVECDKPENNSYTCYADGCGGYTEYCSDACGGDIKSEDSTCKQYCGQSDTECLCQGCSGEDLQCKPAYGSCRVYPVLIVGTVLLTVSLFSCCCRYFISVVENAKSIRPADTSSPMPSDIRSNPHHLPPPRFDLQSSQSYGLRADASHELQELFQNRELARHERIFLDRTSSRSRAITSSSRENGTDLREMREAPRSRADSVERNHSRTQPVSPSPYSRPTPPASTTIAATTGSSRESPQQGRSSRESREVPAAQSRLSSRDRTPSNPRPVRVQAPQANAVEVVAVAESVSNLVVYGADGEDIPIAEAHLI